MSTKHPWTKTVGNRALSMIRQRPRSVRGEYENMDARKPVRLSVGGGRVNDTTGVLANTSPIISSFQLMADHRELEATAFSEQMTLDISVEVRHSGKRLS